VDRQQWVSYLANWAGCEQQRAAVLLRDGDLNTDEQDRIAESLSLSDDELRFVNFIEGVDVLLENLRYLLNSLDYGKKRELANQLGVRDTTISNWLSGKHKPRPPVLAKLSAQLAIPSGLDLETDPLFLSLDPIGERAQKIWLYEHIDKLDRHTLQSLFPALKKLLE
jgi:transcriptional regulator with XRE-family HTH domain